MARLFRLETSTDATPSMASRALVTVLEQWPQCMPVMEMVRVSGYECPHSVEDARAYGEGVRL